jgi:hypothetical protein
MAPRHMVATRGPFGCRLRAEKFFIPESNEPHSKRNARRGFSPLRAPRHSKTAIDVEWLSAK